MFNNAFASAFAEAAHDAAARTAGTPAELAHRQVGIQAGNVLQHTHLAHTRRDRELKAKMKRNSFEVNLEMVRSNRESLVPAQQIAADLEQLTGQAYDIPKMAEDLVSSGLHAHQVGPALHTQLRADWDTFVDSQRGDDGDDFFVFDLLDRR